MTIPYLDLSAQYETIKPEIDSAIARVLRNTSFIGGQELSDFTTKFEQIYGVGNVVPVANGTDALYISMKMHGIGYGDEVITTASSWISTSETISQTGATPVFVDIDDFYTLDASQIEKVISPRTRAIIPVHLYGQMCDMNAIQEIAKKHGLFVIEDCAQSHFSTFNGEKAGTIGDCGTFSFYPGKNLGAFGDAGAIITNDTSLAERCRMFANHGALVKHHHIIEGMNSRMDGIQAAILNVKLDYIIEWTSQRRRVAKEYDQLLRGIESITLPKVRPGTTHSYHVYGIKLENRDALKSFLQEKGISTQIHYPKAMPFMKAYENHHQEKTSFKRAKEHQDTELSLPIYPELTKDMVQHVCDTVRHFCE